jgi:hypothetical protein
MRATPLDNDRRHGHTAHHLSGGSQAAHDEYMHIGCNAFCDISANAEVGESLDSLPSGPPLSYEQNAAVAVLKTSHHTYGDGKERPYSIELPPSHQGRTVELKCGDGFRPTGTRTVLALRLA